MGTIGISRTVAEKEWRPNTTWASVLHSALPEAWGLQRQLVLLMVNKRAPEGTRVPGLVWQVVSVPQPRTANLSPGRTRPDTATQWVSSPTQSTSSVAVNVSVKAAMQEGHRRPFSVWFLMNAGRGSWLQPSFWQQRLLEPM